MLTLLCILTVLLTNQLVSAKQLDPVGSINQQIDWKQYRASWSGVINATSYKTNLTCGQYLFNLTVSTEKVTYDQVPSNRSCVFTIQADDNVNDPSDVKTYNFTSAAIPPGPMNLTIENHPDDRNKQLHLKWKHPSSFSVDRLKTIRYQITYTSSTHIRAPKVIAITEPMANNYTLKDLDENTIYFIEVSAYDEKTKETGIATKGQQLTEKSGISNDYFAVIVIGTTSVIVIAVGAGTYMHFKKKFKK